MTEKKSPVDLAGLTLINDFITPEEEQLLINLIDKSTWNLTLSRRTQHYGYEYSYTKPKSALNPAEPIPELMQFLIEKINSLFKLTQPINQCIINEYMPGQGIAAHTDSNIFGNTVISISLSSNVIMEFTKPADVVDKQEELLKRRSCLVLQGDARYKWRHSIPARKSDTYKGVKTLRGRRLSITFRSVPLTAQG
jgi:alkylated DNA repair dioxygenase AlkB